MGSIHHATTFNSMVSGKETQSGYVCALHGHIIPGPTLLWNCKALHLIVIESYLIQETGYIFQIMKKFRNGS